MPDGQPDRLTQIESRLRASHERVKRLDDELATLRQSIRHRLGELLVHACRNPANALRAPFGLVRLGRAWLRHRAERRRTVPAVSSAALGGRDGTPSGPGPAPAPDLPAIRPTVPPAVARPVVAAVLSPSTAFVLQYESDLVALTRDGWRQQLERARPAFLLIESADEDRGGDWNGPADRDSAADTHELLRLLRYCRERGLRTVLWHTGGPLDARGRVDAASEFDAIFTVDTDLVPRLREACGHGRVDVLPCAAEPHLHNPSREPARPRYAACLAGAGPSTASLPGSGSDRHLVDPASRFGLHVIDDNPESAERMAAAYRCHDVFLNAAGRSPTAVPRRVFESLASGTPVVSTDSLVLRDLLGDCVRLTRSVAGTTSHLEALLNDEETHAREAHLGYRCVHRRHTWRHRLDAIRAGIGLPPPERPRPGVSVVMPVMRPRNVMRAVANFVRQSHPDKELLLVLNNAHFDRDRIRESVRSVEHVQVLELPGAPTLGECLNEGVRQASGRYVAKMDDDDHYGAEYLSDLALAARFSGAEITGKATYYAYVESRDVMALRVVESEHAWVSGVTGATLFVERDVLTRVPFRNVETSVDLRFARDARSAGCRAYSADRFNYVAVRRRDRASHTWKMSDDRFLERCRHPRHGLHLPRAMV